MNRYFFRLPFNSERAYTPHVLAVTPQGQYYWSRYGSPVTPGDYDGSLSRADENTLANSGVYVELRPKINLAFILKDLVAGGDTSTDWRAALLPYSQPTAPFKLRRDYGLKTNHKIGAPKGRVP